MDKTPGVLIANQRVQRPAPVAMGRLRLLVELEPRGRVFFGNLADLLGSRPEPRIAITSRPGRFWNDVFVPTGAPLGVVCGIDAIAFAADSVVGVGPIESMGIGRPVSEAGGVPPGGYVLSSGGFFCGERGAGVECGDAGASEAGIGASAGASIKAEAAAAGDAGAQAEPGDSAGHQAGGGETAGFTRVARGATDGALGGDGESAAKPVRAADGGGGSGAASEPRG